MTATSIHTIPPKFTQKIEIKQKFIGFTPLMIHLIDSVANTTLRMAFFTIHSAPAAT